MLDTEDSLYQCTRLELNDAPCSKFDAGLKTDHYKIDHKTNTLNQKNQTKKTFELKNQQGVLIPLEPQLWTKQQVRDWMQWAVEEFSLRDVSVHAFDTLDGKALCKLTREEFLRLSSAYGGDILISYLCRLHSNSISCLQFQDVSYSFMTEPLSYPLHYNTADCVPPAFAWYDQVASSGISSSLSTKNKKMLQYQHCYLNEPSISSNQINTGQIKLWIFLLELLGNPVNSSIIQWTGENGEFQLNDPEEVARRWGERKNKPSMNYEKLGRALRYYYEKNILSKIHGKRYAYKFDLKLLSDFRTPFDHTSDNYHDSTVCSFPLAKEITN